MVGGRVCLWKNHRKAWHSRWVQKWDYWCSHPKFITSHLSALAEGAVITNLI